MEISFQLTFWDLVIVNPWNWVLIPWLGLTALILNMPLVGPIIGQAFAFLTGH